MPRAKLCSSLKLFVTKVFIHEVSLGLSVHFDLIDGVFVGERPEPRP
jgi:hypothetical protein